MKGGGFEEEYEEPDKKCPVCGQRYNSKLGDVYHSTEEVVGVGDDATLHIGEGMTFVHEDL